MIRFKSVPDRRYVSGQLVWFVVWVAVTSIGACLSARTEGHGTHTELGLPPCPCVALFGRPCPGCGLTTSFTALIHGNLRLAFRAHPLGPLLYAVFTILSWLCIWGWWNRKQLDAAYKPFRWATTAGICVFIAFGIGRFILSPHYGDKDPYHQAFVAANAIRR